MAGQQTNEISTAGLVKMIKESIEWEGIEWDMHFKMNRTQ
jgi:hypothetical protein